MQAMDGKELTQNQHANMILTEYWKVLESDIGKLMGETKNGSIKKGYVNVMKSISTHRKRWEHQFKVTEENSKDVPQEEQLQKA